VSGNATIAGSGINFGMLLEILLISLWTLLIIFYQAQPL
jgi:hypothetical protein